MQNTYVVGIDVAKSVFQLQGNDEKGKALFKKKLNRKDLLPFLRSVPPCIVAMEACGGSHHLGRTLKSIGFEVRLISPQFVKPFVKGNKNDRNDAAAICEAAVRPSMHFVPLKEVWHQSVQALHRMREEQVTRKTALMNMMRGFLTEFGIVTTLGAKALKESVNSVIHEAPGNFPGEFIETLREVMDELSDVETRITRSDRRLKKIAEENPSCQKIMKLKGLGTITATALVAATPDPKVFKNGRQYAAWLGLVPKHSGTGGKVNIGKISKRGDKNLRALLVHGGRSALRFAGTSENKIDKWAQGIKDRRGANKAAVALANKNARIIWAKIGSTILL